MAIDNSDTVVTPLFQGMGTHYSFLYVGTPAQRFAWLSQCLYTFYKIVIDFLFVLFLSQSFGYCW